MGAGLAGIIVKGHGEGSYYMGLKQYKLQFKKKLGFIPYKGTLNIKSSRQKIRAFLKRRALIRIKGFMSWQKRYFGLRCYKAKFNDNNVALIVPDKTSHDSDIIEIIAKFSIKKKFGLKNKSKVMVE